MTGRRAQASSTRRAWLRAAVASLWAGALPRIAGAQAEKRSALVIGNGAYKSAALRNPVGDAQAVAASLKELGYDVVLKQDTTLYDLIESLRDFSLRSAQSDVRVLFYAGHGIQAKGRNYLLPVDTEPRSEDEIAAKAADVSEFVERISAYPQGINVVILDACRVNPFKGGVIRLPDGRVLTLREATRSGLARLDAPLGTLVAFSTAPNGVALDAPSSAHSIYVKHLLANIQTPGLPIERLFKLVRVGVAQETQRLQVPWESSSITTEFCFRLGSQGQCG